MTMPLPRTITSVLAVPRSIPISSEKRPSSQLSGLIAKKFLPCECALPSWRLAKPHPQERSCALVRQHSQ